MITKEGIIKKIEKEKRKIREFGVVKFGLFGSFTRNKEKKNSDIDILVTFDNRDYGDQYFELLFFLKRLLKRKIDLIPEESLRKELLYVKKEAEYVAI